MNLTVLKEYCASLTDVDADALLSCWGLWASTATDHLGYKSPSYAVSGKSSNRCVWLNDTELDILDQAVGGVRRNNEMLFKALILRYVYRQSIRGIMRSLKLHSTNKVYKLLDDAIAKFKFYLKGRINNGSHG